MKFKNKAIKLGLGLVSGTLNAGFWDAPIIGTLTGPARKCYNRYFNNSHTEKNTSTKTIQDLTTQQNFVTHIVELYKSTNIRLLFEQRIQEEIINFNVDQGLSLLDPLNQKETKETIKTLKNTNHSESTNKIKALEHILELQDILNATTTQNKNTREEIDELKKRVVDLDSVKFDRADIQEIHNEILARLEEKQSFIEDIAKLTTALKTKQLREKTLQDSITQTTDPDTKQQLESQLLRTQEKIQKDMKNIQSKNHPDVTPEEKNNPETTLRLIKRIKTSLQQTTEDEESKKQKEKERQDKIKARIYKPEKYEHVAKAEKDDYIASAGDLLNIAEKQAQPYRLVTLGKRTASKLSAYAGALGNLLGVDIVKRNVKTAYNKVHNRLVHTKTPQIPIAEKKTSDEIEKLEKKLELAKKIVQSQKTLQEIKNNIQQHEMKANNSETGNPQKQISQNRINTLREREDQETREINEITKQNPGFFQALSRDPDTILTAINKRLKRLHESDNIEKDASGRPIEEQDDYIAYARDIFKDAEKNATAIKRTAQLKKIQQIAQLKQLEIQNNNSIQKIETQLATIQKDQPDWYSLSDKVERINNINTLIAKNENNPKPQAIADLTKKKKTLQNILALEKELNAKKKTAIKRTAQLKKIQQMQPNTFQEATTNLENTIANIEREPNQLESSQHDDYIASAGELINKADQQYDEPTEIETHKENATTESSLSSEHTAPESTPQPTILQQAPSVESERMQTPRVESRSSLSEAPKSLPVSPTSSVSSNEAQSDPSLENKTHAPSISEHTTHAVDPKGMPSKTDPAGKKPRTTQSNQNLNENNAKIFGAGILATAIIALGAALSAKKNKSAKKI